MIIRLKQCFSENESEKNKHRVDPVGALYTRSNLDRRNDKNYHFVTWKVPRWSYELSLKKRRNLANHVVAQKINDKKERMTNRRIERRSTNIAADPHIFVMSSLSIYCSPIFQNDFDGKIVPFSSPYLSHPHPQHILIILVWISNFNAFRKFQWIKF